MESLSSAGVFELVPRARANGRVVSSKWVFRIKETVDRKIERFKARLCTRGISQVHGIDYDETFAPVAKFQSIRIILAITASQDLELDQMDVKTAFLYGELEEEVYMEQPEGYNKDSSLVWKLQKALYGLKQSPRMWYKKLDSTLKDLRFTRFLRRAMRHISLSVHVLRPCTRPEPPAEAKEHWGSGGAGGGSLGGTLVAGRRARSSPQV
jgi:hypothetical protein